MRMTCLGTGVGGLSVRDVLGTSKYIEDASWDYTDE